jgi:16S rRNA (guanine1207-N2)-methyltransferase
MAGALAHLHPGDRPLVVDEPAGLLVDTLAAQGAAASAWLRRAGGPQAAQAWPAAGPFTSAYVRLPKAKDALDFALHAVASLVPAGAEIAVFGANDEGIRSAASHLEVVAEDVATVDARRHSRVLMGRRRAAIGGHKTSLSSWRRESEIAIAGGTLRWVSYPGLFAGGGLDEGTALLLAHLPDLADTARVLDFGCGTGIIGAGVRMKAPRARIDLLDADAVALEAARENVPEARLLLGDGLAAAGTVRYHVILSNPPLHDGVSENYGTLERLIGEAPEHLVAGGVLQIVTQRRIKATELMQTAFGNVALVTENGRFRVLRTKRGG